MRSSPMIHRDDLEGGKPCVMRMCRARFALAAAFLALGVLLPSLALARLSVLPGRTSGPRPTGTPQVVGSKVACQEKIGGASAALAGGVRAAFADCLAASLPCVLEQAGAPACCAAATPACVREAEEIAAAGAAFVADVVSPACSGVPFADLVSEDGLDFGRTASACLRLEPQVVVDGLGSLAACLQRLVIEDVLHLAASVEHPRALEALVCMDLENLFPGVLREFPATCEDRPAATPSPAPTPEPTPSPAGSPGASPTPTGSPGGPTPSPGAATPTPAGATPTPQPTGGAGCTQVDVTVAVNYSAVDFSDVSGVTVGLGYPQSLGLPGFGNQPTVLERVTNLTGVQGGLFSVGDDDAQNLLNIGLVSLGSSIPPGSFARVRFDCASGGVPPSSAFTCTVDAATFEGNTVAPTQCVITVSQP